jgi:L-threonylcarbamoyladenylate synthase
MKNSYSNIFTFNKKILWKTIKSLNNRGLVGLPTETVYGLGGNAYSKRAVKKIFKLKGRPRFNPLIVHYHNIKDAEKDVIINQYVKKLYKRFCPGPITFVLKKKITSKIDPLVSANLKTVAIRFPSNKITRTILKKTDFPLAMPSANKSTNVSPVNSLDVFDEFKSKLKIIIDGGKCKIGIESTVIDLTSIPKILRPGVIDKKNIEKVLKTKILTYRNKGKVLSPGMLKKHYSPGIPVLINQKKHDGKSAYIYIGNKHKNKKNFFSLNEKNNLFLAASNLYKMFRIIKNKGYKKIQINKIPKYGAGIAINDRINRASKF